MSCDQDDDIIINPIFQQLDEKGMTRLGADKVQGIIQFNYKLLSTVDQKELQQIHLTEFNKEQGKQIKTRTMLLKLQESSRAYPPKRSGFTHVETTIPTEASSPRKMISNRASSNILRKNPIIRNTLKPQAFSFIKYISLE
ncbi:hypothetical protein SS50377_24986 [Spironucleus salmonicida]|uniref:Uncharacterized protein n=1 Tax=Spironucleus salmonicida TaxID=348837 RepID=V6LIB1_9EUKA|nr:hypothetical protein SS50377_24983 [Spironucleus salmonicida]KAH0572871.1 hypothetical protein SS50377_24986 [Spironucleus salmonicida]|eukprot:EST44277.1 Hypothetical protein SS50377_15908 [Spironucleus salmonicida]